MAGHVKELAERIKAALEAEGGLKAIVDELYEALPDLQRPAVIDVGANLWLVCLPGYGPLSNPKDFVYLADVVV